MNKTDLIKEMAEKSNLSQKEAASALEAFMSTITDSLKNGISVVVPGFGSFSVKDRAARTGRNPQTGQTIQIAAARVPHFKAGSKLKEDVAH